jgi:predicted nucleotidyltransferase
MDKEKLKNIIRQAIEKGPYKKEIKKLSLFGSYLSGHQKEDSDIDLLIEFAPSAKIGFFKLVNIQESIAKIVGCKVDLLTPEGISKFLRQNIINTSEAIYEG